MVPLNAVVVVVAVVVAEEEQLAAVAKVAPGEEAGRVPAVAVGHEEEPSRASHEFPSLKKNSWSGRRRSGRGQEK